MEALKPLVIDTSPPEYRNGSKSLFRLKVYRSWRSQWGYLLLFFALLGLAAYLGDDQPVMTDRVPLFFKPGSIELTVPVVPLIAFLVILRPFALVYDAVHEITDYHIRSRVGILSFRTRSVEYAYEDLLGVEVDQGIFGRMFNYGDIQLGVAETDAHEVQLMDISHPAEVAALIASRIDKTRIERRVDPLTRRIEELVEPNSHSHAATVQSENVQSENVAPWHRA